MDHSHTFKSISLLWDVYFPHGCLVNTTLKTAKIAVWRKALIAPKCYLWQWVEAVSFEGLGKKDPICCILHSICLFSLVLSLVHFQSKTNGNKVVWARLPSSGCFYEMPLLYSCRIQWPIHYLVQSNRSWTSAWDEFIRKPVVKNCWHWTLNKLWMQLSLCKQKVRVPPLVF